MKKITLAIFAALSLGACKDLAVQDQNSGSLTDLQTNPTPTGLSTAAQGLMWGSRFDMPLQVILVGAQGREGWSLDPSDPGWRNVMVVFDNTTFYAGSFFNWRDIYRNIRTANVVLDGLNTISSEAGKGFTDPQKEAVRGFVKTFMAYDLLNIITTRDDNGAVIDPSADFSALPGPVATKAAVYVRIVQLLDQAQTHLTTAGSTAFPLRFTPGFTGFDTPASFLKFNRALRARVAVYLLDYATAITALGASFVDTTKSLTLGTYHSYSTNSGDALPNPLLYDPNGRVLVGHPSLRTDAQMAVAGDTNTLDLRFRSKTILLKNAAGVPTPRSFNGLTSPFSLNVYPSNVSPIPVIRNEDLILLRSEANWFTGSKAAALDDLNYVRRTAGGLPNCGLVGSSCTVTVASSDAAYTDELLYNRRYSLLWEGGHRWIDLHRFGRLNTLPLDRTGDHVFSGWPVPSDECLNRTPQPAGCTQPVTTQVK